MLKIKKPIPFNLNTFDEDEYNKNQNEIKNSIKKLYIENQNKKKTIDEYEQLVTQIREEYAKLQNKCVELENTLQKYKNYIENSWSKIERNNRHYRKPIRKTKIPYYRYDNEIENEGYLTGDENEEDENEYYTRQGTSKPKRKKRIVYIDEIDGNDDDNEQEEEEEPEVVTKVKNVTPKKKIKKDVKKVGIMKSI